MALFFRIQLNLTYLWWFKASLFSSNIWSILITYLVSLVSVKNKMSKSIIMTWFITSSLPYFWRASRNLSCSISVQKSCYLCLGLSKTLLRCEPFVFGSARTRSAKATPCLCVYWAFLVPTKDATSFQFLPNFSSPLMNFSCSSCVHYNEIGFSRAFSRWAPLSIGFARNRIASYCPYFITWY